MTRKHKLAILLAVFAAAATIAAPPSLAATSPSAPNILVIVTDDQRIDTLDVMPTTRQLFETQGTRFPNAFATTPTCCPSRASILTGRFAHNHNVKENTEAELLDHTTTIERRLQQEGYTTAIFGKFLNAWNLSRDPPYFDKWSIFNNGPYTAFKVNEQGTSKTINQYATGYVGSKAAQFVQQAESDDARPWFLYVAPTAPHLPYTPDVPYLNAPVPDFVPNPAFFETDRTDKPPYVRKSRNDPADVLDHRVAQLRMLMSADDMVSTLFSALDANGETQNTLAFFMSDNGYLWGEHGLESKPHPYTHSVKIPLYVRWPNRVAAGVADPRLVANIDIAPTIREAVGLGPGLATDGVSLFKAYTRDRMLLERPVRPNTGAPPWAAIRTDSYQYTEHYGDGTLEYTEDSTPPDTPTLTDTDPDSPATDNSPRVKGSAEAGSTIKLYRAATTSGCKAANLAATGTVSDFSSAGLAVSVPDDHTTRFRATATDEAGNVSACSSSSIIYTEDSTPPAAPTLTDTDPNSPANDNAPLVKGSADAGSTVRLYKAATTGDCIGANQAAAGTAASFASPGLAVSVPNNTTTRFRAIAMDAAGNASPCSSSSIVYKEDSTPPLAPTLTDTDPDSPANENLPLVKGSAGPGTTVRLYSAATTADCTPANVVATGAAAPFASPGLAASVSDDSTTRFRATATDSAGNTSPCSSSSIAYVEDSTVPAAPVMTDTDPPSPANDNSPSVKGIAESGATVRLYKGTDCSGAVLASGTDADFATTGLSASVPDDSITRFRATATDQAGNVSACSPTPILYREDSTPPAEPTLTDTDPDSPANNNAPFVKGNAEAASTVRLYKAATIAGCTPTNFIVSGTAANFSSPGIQVLVRNNSTTTFRATATDRAGNVSACSASAIVYIEDSSLPVVAIATLPDPPMSIATALNLTS